MANNSPSIALVLNAHLPFVRKPQYPQFYEERWLFEVISETYLPLLRMFRKLELENIPFRVNMVLSPTLLAMLSDELLCERYIEWQAERSPGSTFYSAAIRCSLGCEWLVSHEILIVVKNEIIRSKSFSRCSYLLIAILAYQLGEVASLVVGVINSRLWIILI